MSSSSVSARCVAPEYENFVPACTVDWTLPSTRRKDCEEIERSCRGVRGLWRKFTPRLRNRNERTGFSSTARNPEESSDTGSVRRYRVDGKNNDDEDSSRSEGEEEAIDAGNRETKLRPRLGGRGALSGWSHWGMKRGNDTGESG